MAKITVDIADPILARAKARARAERTTLREIVEAGILRELKFRDFLAKKPFVLRDGSFEGTGTVEGVDLSNWSQIKRLMDH